RVVRKSRHGTVAIGNRGHIMVRVTVGIREAIAVLIFVRGQAIVGPKDVLLAGLMEGERIGIGAAVEDERGVDPRRIAIGLGGAVVGKECREATGPMKDNALGRIAHIQAHIMTCTKVPVVAQVAGGVVVLSTIVALNAFID